MFQTIWDTIVENLNGPLPLAIVALLGYIVGKLRKENQLLTAEIQCRRESKRAISVCKHMEKVVQNTHSDLAQFENHLARFKKQIQALSAGDKTDACLQELCREAELIMRPTLRLTSQLSGAYDEIRQQSGTLMSFTEVRTDPLTGVCNRRALDESLINRLQLLKRYESGFSIAIVDIDHFKRVNDEQGHLFGDEILTKVAQLMDNNVRDTDQVARYGGEEFMIVMPYTALEGAAVFSDRVRQRVAETLPVTISIGLSTAKKGDTPQQLIERADEALYAAKGAGRNRVFINDGESCKYFNPEEHATPVANLEQLAKLSARTTDEPVAEVTTRN